MATAALAAVMGLAGCDGDDGDRGPQGDTGATGPKGDTGDTGPAGPTDLVGLAKPESCATCHGHAGDHHQSVYADYIDTTLGLTINDVTSVDNLDGTYALTVTYTVSGYPGSLESTSVYVVQYTADGQFVNSGGYFPTLAAGTCDADGVCVSENTVAYNIDAFNAGAIVVKVANRLLPIEERQYNPAAGKRVQMYGDLATAAWAIGAMGTYESVANVSACENCHSATNTFGPDDVRKAPYRKHGNIEAVVGGVPNFTQCKACHTDDRTGGHEDWQWMIDDPVAWATGELTPEIRALYPYRAVLMNDVHMSHAMELPYPQSMANCATCHAGKLDAVLADDKFTPETCKSCHPIQDSGAYAQRGRPPAFETLWTAASLLNVHGQYIGLDQDPPRPGLTGPSGDPANCLVCHDGVAARVFSAYHSGYDARIYDATGARYSDTKTVSIDSVDVDLDAGTITVEFSSSDPLIVPELGISFYGWDSKDLLVSQHTRDSNTTACPTRGCRMEYIPESVCPPEEAPCDNPLFTEEEGSGAGAWIVTLDMAAYAADVTDPIPTLIADGKVRKAEIAVSPMLVVGGVEVALDSVLETVDVTASGTDAFVDNYFKGTAAIVETAKCNNCHDQLAVTFHSGSGRGGDATVCRMCHVTTNGGSHLEMQSRSITSYAHAVHSFQAFDTDETDFTDPVELERYKLHIHHAFPVFTAQACEACHTDGVYNVPDQSKSMPALLSAAYEWNVERNIGSVPEVAVGPGFMACGGCHRAEMINHDDAVELASFYGHSAAMGYLIENGDDDAEIYGLIEKFMEMFD